MNRAHSRVATPLPFLFDNLQSTYAGQQVMPQAHINPPADQARQLEERVAWLESMVFSQFVALTVCLWWVVPAMFVLLIVLLPVLVLVHRYIPTVARWSGRILSPIADLFRLMQS